MRDDRVNQFVVVLLVVFISAVFLSMIRSFLMAIFIAGIFSALSRPIYHWLDKKLKGRRSLASILTLLLIIIVVVLPLGVLTGVVTGQAIKVSQTAVPWVKTQLSQPGGVSAFLETIPYYDKIAPHSELILRKAAELVGSISQFLVNNLSTAAMGAVNLLSRPRPSIASPCTIPSATLRGCLYR